MVRVVLGQLLVTIASVNCVSAAAVMCGGIRDPQCSNPGMVIVRDVVLLALPGIVLTRWGRRFGKPTFVVRTSIKSVAQ